MNLVPVLTCGYLCLQDQCLIDLVALLVNISWWREDVKKTAIDVWRNCSIDYNTFLQSTLSQFRRLRRQDLRPVTPSCRWRGKMRQLQVALAISSIIGLPYQWMYCSVVFLSCVIFIFHVRVGVSFPWFSVFCWSDRNGSSGQPTVQFQFNFICLKSRLNFEHQRVAGEKSQMYQS